MRFGIAVTQPVLLGKAWAVLVNGTSQLAVNS